MLDATTPGKEFNFAIFVEGKNTISSENMAQYGFSKQDGDRINAMNKALNEFPDCSFVDARLVMVTYK